MAIFLGDGAKRSMIVEIEVVDVADDFGVARIDVEFVILFGAAFVAEGGFADGPKAFLRDGDHFILGIFGGLFALELIEGLKDGQHGTAHRS